MVCARAAIGRGRLSEIERGQVLAPREELARIQRALDELMEARRQVVQFAEEVGWPAPGGLL
jgi:hypothetical protein